MNLQSPAWRISHLYSIKDKKGQLVPFRPNDAQRHYYNHRHLCNHILKARQLGFSTYNMMEAIDTLLFQPGAEIGIIDYSLPDAKRKLGMIKTAYTNLDNAHIHPPEVAALGAAIKRQIPLKFTPLEATHMGRPVAYCGVSLRGGTLTNLYISELGKTAIFAPIKAEEIRSGALNTIAPGNRITIESTHEGGKAGMHYELLRTAIDHDPTKLSPIDFKFHFFPWWIDHTYTLPVHHGQTLRPEIIEYFMDLEPKRIEFCKIHDFTYQPLTIGQMYWYDVKERQQKHAMKKEFPSLPGEAFDAPVEGAIYAREMYGVRAAGRVRDFAPSPTRTLVTAWDLGMSDATAIWLIQLDGPEYRWLDWYEASGFPIGHYIDHIRGWMQKYQRPIATHLLPHDSQNRNLHTGKTYIQALHEAGMTNTTVIPRTTDIWHGINHLRDLLPQSWFHKTNTDTERVAENGTRYPSGVACLEGYHKRISRDGIIVENTPVHDQYSHTADAARTFADAHRLGLLPAHTLHQGPTTPRVTIRRPHF